MVPDTKLALTGTENVITMVSKIFDPLFATMIFGTGLGFAVYTGIVEQHGRTISVKNNPTTL
ncbi:hypothetical protein C5F50_02945 [Nitrosopumilus ureiphilus]|uniref:Uncharacterized protein n=2 Tax=Nitrosopumilus ureiphilus TaxID=1470067 RepID=A0A7D5M8X0_9ARCH|nr:hypothetical protein C5F50_02945 [Nitrosopumilus ureiphilus]